MATSKGRDARAHESSFRAERHRIERAIELYLAKCYRDRTPARVSELALFLGANRSHLSRVVPQVIGEALSSAMRRRQLAYAERLLCETSLSLTEIAVSAAFGTERTLRRAFMQAFGITLAAYRRKATK